MMVSISGRSPTTPSTNCKVKVSDHYDDDPFDVSDNNFTIGISAIAVTAPNGGENLCKSSIYNIQWNSYCFTGNVKIDYSTNGGSTWVPVVATTPNDGNYDWTVPTTPSTECRVRVSDAADGDPYDISNANFVINDATIAIISPNGAENWCAGYLVHITWGSSCVMGNVKIELSTNSGSTWDTTLAESTPNDGDHSVYVPDTPSEYCRIKISDLDGDPYDISESDFTITSANILVTSPNGGEFLRSNQCDTVRWTSLPDTGRVKIYYSTNGGSSWTFIDSTENDGFYEWWVPSLPGTPPTNVYRNCRIQVCYYYDCPCDMSDQGFTIHFYTNVTLTSFDASLRNGLVQIEWQTATEIDNLGFNIYRSTLENDKYAKINQELIPAEGSAISGVSYSYKDSLITAGSTYYYKLEDIDLNGNSKFHGPISVKVTGLVPTDYNLTQNYPNPFNPTTYISFSLPQAEKVKLEIYNLLGQKVITLLDNEMQAGSHTINWDGKNDRGEEVGSGIYFYRIAIGQFSQTKKMLLLR